MSILILGGGVEFPSNYSQWRVEYGSMESITNIQSSYIKLIDGECPPISNAFFMSSLLSFPMFVTFNTFLVLYAMCV